MAYGGRTLVRAVPAAAWLVLLALGSGGAAGPAALTVTLVGIGPGGFLPGTYASCVPAADGHAAPGPDRNPEVRWSAGPPGTRSYAIITDDPDAPSSFGDANKEGRTLPVDAPRTTFYHWVLVDVPATIARIGAGVDSNGPSPKPPGPTAHGVRGVNGMGPAHGGYDGPCPPWNDLRVHHYHFTVYALDVDSLGLTGSFTGPQVLAAMQGHVLAQGEAVGLYSTNPSVRSSLGVQ